MCVCVWQVDSSATGVMSERLLQYVKLTKELNGLVNYYTEVDSTLNEH